MHGDFFSHVYHTFTRWTTDFFQMWLTADIKLLFLLIMLQFVWTSILNFISFISQQIDFSISVNKTPHVSAAVLSLYWGGNQFMDESKMNLKFYLHDHLYATSLSPRYKSACLYNQSLIFFSLFCVCLCV